MLLIFLLLLLFYYQCRHFLEFLFLLFPVLGPCWCAAQVVVLIAVAVGVVTPALQDEEWYGLVEVLLGGHLRWLLSQVADHDLLDCTHSLVAYTCVQ